MENCQACLGKINEGGWLGTNLSWAICLSHTWLRQGLTLKEVWGGTLAWARCCLCEAQKSTHISAGKADISPLCPGAGGLVQSANLVLGGRDDVQCGSKDCQISFSQVEEGVTLKCQHFCSAFGSVWLKVTETLIKLVFGFLCVEDENKSHLVDCCILLSGSTLQWTNCCACSSLSKAGMPVSEHYLDETKLN